MVSKRCLSPAAAAVASEVNFLELPQAKFEVQPFHAVTRYRLYALRIPWVMNFREFCKGEVRGIPVPCTWVNKGKRKGETSSPSTGTQRWLAAAHGPES